MSRVITRQEVAAQIRKAPGTIKAWERIPGFPRGPRFSAEAAGYVAAFSELVTHLKPRDAHRARSALPPPGTDAQGVMGASPLFLLFPRTSSKAQLIRSLEEAVPELPLNEDVRIVRLDVAIAAMAAHFDAHSIDEPLTSVPGAVIRLAGRRRTGRP